MLEEDPVALGDAVPVPEPHGVAVALPEAVLLEEPLLVALADAVEHGEDVSEAVPLPQAVLEEDPVALGDAVPVDDIDPLAEAEKEDFEESVLEDELLGLAV